MEDFIRDHPITRSTEDDQKIVAIHSSYRGRVCYPAIVDCDLPCFYVYDTLFMRLKLSIPFNEFECAALSYLRVAPTQLHPVSWGYIKAFQILMQTLGLPATIGVFFSFFQVKGAYTGKWVSLNVIPRRRLLRPVDSSYKRWKQYYFRVSCLDKHKDLFLTNGRPRHPFTWASHPRQFLQYDTRCMSGKEVEIVTFLNENCTFPKENEAPHCLDLVNLEGHQSGLFGYLGKCHFIVHFTSFLRILMFSYFVVHADSKLSNMDKERLRRLQEEIAATEANKGDAVTIILPPPPPANPIVNRADSEETHESQPPLKRVRGDKGVSIAIPPSAAHLIPTSVISGLENLKINSPASLAGVLYNVGHAIRLSAEYAGSLEGEHKASRDRIKDLSHKNSEANKVIKQERAAIVKRDEEISKNKNEISRLTQELGTSRSKITELEAKLKASESEINELRNDNQRLNGEVKTLELGSLQNYLNGYAECLKHVKHLHPKEDLSVYGPFHEIVEGQLVNPSALKESGAKTVPPKST